MSIIGKRKSCFGCQGFTLVEIILVAMLLSVIMLAVYGVLSNGIKIWQRMNITDSHEDITVFLERFGSDARNAFGLQGSTFQGAEEGCAFSTLVNFDKTDVRTSGRVAYRYDEGRRALVRTERDYSQAYTLSSEGVRVSVLVGVRAFTLSYYTQDPQMKVYAWKPEWTQEGMPAAVRINFSIDEGAGMTAYTRTVTIPVVDRYGA